MASSRNLFYTQSNRGRGPRIFSEIFYYILFIFYQVDGSVAMWDLRETSSIHKATEVEDQEYSLRYPTYDTGKHRGLGRRFCNYHICVNHLLHNNTF